LSTIHKARSGDTFSLIAAQTMGSDTYAAEIARANPGIREPITAGTTIRIPSNRQNKKGFLSSGLDIHVSGNRLVTVPSFSIAMRVDAIRKCTFSLPNEISTRAILKPLDPLDCAVGYDGSELMIGQVGTVEPENKGNAKTLVVSAYSDPARIEKSPPPASAFPLEFVNMNLEQIAEHLCGTMGVVLFFDAEPGARFKRVDIKQDQAILKFLADLASQRGLVITDDAFGSLVFWKPSGLGGPVLDIDDTSRTDATVSVKINDENYYSSVTGIMSTKSKRKTGRQYTVSNPFLTGIVRPYSYTVEDIDQGELETAVNSTAARMFAGVFSATVTISEWRDKFGNVLTPNTLIRLRSPDNYIDEFTELMIAGVTLNNEAGSETAELECVLPGVFSGEMPEAMPWT